MLDEVRYDGEVLNKPTNDEYMVNGVILVNLFHQPKRKLIHMSATGEQEVWDGVKLSYDSCFGHYQSLIQKNAYLVGEG